jgi:DNA-binding Xre family transcriptional regulator
VPARLGVTQLSFACWNKQLAQQIDLREVSVKRIFSRSSLSLARLEQICLALDVSIEEVARISVEQSTDASEAVTLEQEGEVAADPNLLACYYLIANGRTGPGGCAAP